MAEDPGATRRLGPTIVGLVLAGGRSSRFGEADKLRAELRGRPLFHHAVLAAAASCDEVIVVVARDATDPPPLPTDAMAPVRVVRDVLVDTGPLAGLVAGLEAAGSELVLVAGGDQPDLTSALLRLLIDSVRQADAAVLAEHDRPRPLPAVLRRAPASVAARTRLMSDQRSLRALIADLEPVVVPERTWRRVDPDGAWRRDIDEPADLSGP
ncbi:MAG TPA: molybdenum cofactor guanylyltransferase [Candidatus Saccharimonadia bacterium]|nr:molybdenum cofactor guanylyltransferase [Candidatus Saccharimonadia bacterium]